MVFSKLFCDTNRFGGSGGGISDEDSLRILNILTVVNSIETKVCDDSDASNC